MKFFVKFKRIFLIIILFLLYTCLCAFSYTNTVFSTISNNVFRLHVIANSDTQEDQNLKYKVRDNILNYVSEITKDISSKENIINAISTHSEEIKKVAEETIISNGYNYNVNINIGNFEFPTKIYGNVSFPSGYYDALRVEIGEAKGQNWWCVMFPPLCFIDVSSGILPDESKKTLQDNLSSEEYNLISDKEYNLKFKIVEFLQNISVKVAQK